MASRRLTISSLLCSDDLPPSPVAGPSYSPPFDSGPSRASTNSPRRHTPHSELLRYAEEDVVPLSFQPALHLRRRTPSPSPPSYASPLTGSSGSRRSFKEIAFDNHQGQQPVSVTNSSTFNYAGRTARSQSSRPDSPHASMVRTSSNTVHRSPPHMYTVSESPQTHHSPQRLPFGVPTDHVRSPRHLNSSVHALMNSSTQSYVGVYNLQRRSSSRSDVNVSPAPLDAQASFAPSPPAPRPSASPVQSLHRSSYSSNVSSTYSTNSAPQVSSPASSSSSQRPHSRHAIASLLTDSPSVSRPSAASLPHILNSPTQSRSPAATSSSVQGVGMEGLEALVQAATQERRRLGGEVYSEGVAVDAHPVNRSSRSSPFAERGESNSHLSPLSERGGFHHGRLSPAVDRAAINQTKSPFMQHSTLYPSPPTRNTPLQSPMRLPSSSLHLTRAVGTLPVPLHPQPEHHFVQRPHSPPFHEREGQPPPKRRRGSEGVAIVAHSPKHSRQTSFASSSSQDSPPSIHLPPKTEPSLEYSSRVVPAFPPSSPSAKPLTSSAHYVDMQDVGLATPMVDVKVEDLTSSVDLEKPSHSSVEPSSVRIQSPSRGRILPTAVEGDMSHQHPSPIALEPHIEADHPDAEAKLHRQDIVAQRRDDAKHSGSVKKKTRLSHKEKVDKPAKVIRHEHVPSGKSGLQISLEHVETTQDDDPYDWLMEHYGGASSAPTHHPVVRNKEKSPDFRPVLPKNDHSRDSHSIVGSSARLSVQPAKAVMKESKIAHHPPPTRSPSPIATLEEEIGAAEEHLPIRATTTLHRGSVHGQQGGKATPDIDMDLEAELDFVAGPRGTNRDMKHKSDASELDVEDELLSLLDDMPHPRRASTHVHPRPDMLKALSPLPTANAVSEQALTHVNIIRPKSSAKSTSKPDCESMPPPQTSDPAQAREESTSSKKGEASVFASMKKKDGAAKPGVKKQTAAKPKAPKASSASKLTVKTSDKNGSSTPVPSTSSTALTVPNTSGKAKKTSSHPSSTVSGTGVAAKRAVSNSVGAAASRSRSTSVMPGTHDAETVADKKASDEPEEEPVDDDKLYCICKTKYDEDRVMIACDRCDEWYHTQCVNMPDLEVDLVDQFICPICIANRPHLTLKTTYKRRCYSGLQHSHPSSASACHKPARGAVSKYCSDECAVTYMQAKIRRWGGDKVALWAGVKDVDKREAVVVRCLEEDDCEDEQSDAAMKLDADVDARVEVVKPSKTKIQREIDRLHLLLSRLPVRRDVLKKEEEILLWRESLVELAVARAEAMGECGWDQRLCFGDDEIAEFGAEVLQSYDPVKDLGSSDDMQVDGNGDWWCRGKKKCDRHAGWQKLRQGETELDKELLNTNLDRITAEERELRNRIEDMLKESDANSTLGRKSTQSVPGLGPLKLLNGDSASSGEVNGWYGAKARVNGVGTDQGAKKGKKRKPE